MTREHALLFFAVCCVAGALLGYALARFTYRQRKGTNCDHHDT